jgi:Fe-S-cluster containining protein
LDLVSIADRAFAEARAKAGDWIACRAGCDACCRRPFAIGPEDARRLLRGLEQAPLEVAAGIRERARRAWSRLEADFPGDAASGELTESAEWREWFFARHSGLACPVLDEAAGVCLLYQDRPVCCRLYGPLIEIGGQISDPCHLCYAGASAEQIAGTKVTVKLPGGAPAEPDTVIAYVLSRSAAL